MKKKRLHFDISKCLACRTCELVCCVGHSLSRDLFKAIKEKKIALPKIKVSVNKGKNFPISCRHCDDPKCVDACIARALTYDLQRKEVIHDKDRCVGCWMCVMVCPYGAIRPDKTFPLEGLGGPIPVGKSAKIPVRCDHCKDLDEPQCAKNCPTKAISYKEKNQ